MTLQQIDDALTAWNQRLAAIAENLLELQAEPTWRSLTGAGGQAKTPITGETAARVNPALSAMLGIFEHFGLLQAAIDRAARLRKSLPSLFGAEARLAELERLLFGRSIQLPAVDVPLEQRTLLSGSATVQSISPADLLQAMSAAFTTARDAVLAVSHAWSGLAVQMDRAETQLASLARQTASLGAAIARTLRDAQRLLATLKDRANTDPLGAAAELSAQIQPVIDRALELMRRADQLHRRIHEARAEFDRLLTLHREALAAEAEAREKIADCAGLPALLAEAMLAKLREWLDRLEDRCANGMLDAAETGLGNWRRAVEAASAGESHACAAWRAAVEWRSELRGRLQALQAKARVYGLAERESLVDLARRAEALLYRKPTDLARAAAAVAGYEKLVSREGAGGGLAR